VTVKRSVDEYLNRAYSRDKYNCFHLAAEVWMDLTGRDLIQLYGDAIRIGLDSRRLSRKLIEGFRELPKPQDPCIVLLQNPRQSPHIGVYLRGRVLHIREHAGVRFEPMHIARLGFTKTRYALPC
jgi:hypothetical protein